MPKSKARQLLEYAESKVPECETWIDLHNAVYGIGGKFAELFPSQATKLAFQKTKEHAAIRDLMSGLPTPKASPLIEKTTECNGKILVRVPKTLHAALLLEADAEGVSLNQLILAKLSLQLQAVAGGELSKL